MKTKISVLYSGINFWDEAYSDILYFDTEEEADCFISKIKDRMDVDQIIKTSTISWKFEGRKKTMNDEQLNILLEEATDIKILIALG